MKTTEQEIADLEKEQAELKSLFRIGTVTAVNSTSRLARVSWNDGNRSAWLKVLQHSGAALSITAAGSHDDGDGNTIAAHTHSGTVGAWMPSIGDKVLSIHRPGGDGDGWILGCY